MRKRFMRPTLLSALVIGAFFVMSVVTESAHAIPPFARKYQTSCNTCHIAMPKLNAFGRAFRANGFFWPGEGKSNPDNNARKIKAVEMGNAHFASRATIDESVPLGFVLDWDALVYTPKVANTSVNPNTIDSVLGEVLIAYGGTIGDNIGYAGAFSAAPTTNAEAGFIVFNDIVGPENAVNLRAGILWRGPDYMNMGTDSLVLDEKLSGGQMAYAFKGTGGTASFEMHRFRKPVDGFELYGIVGGYFQYTLGIGTDFGVNGGDNNFQKSAYIALEYQINGMRLDGVGGAKGMNSFEDDHIKIQAWAAYGTGNNGTSDLPINEKKLAFGAHVEWWYKIVELNLGWQYQSNNKQQAFGGDYLKGNAMAIQAELAALLMNGTIIPAIRFDQVLVGSVSGTGVYSTASAVYKQSSSFVQLAVRVQLKANVQLGIGTSLNLKAKNWDEWDGNAVRTRGTLEWIKANIKVGF